MEVFHISERKYPTPYLLKAETFDGDSFFYQTLSEDNKRINDFLSSLRPEGEPSRRKCIFAFARKEYCVLFGKDLIQAGKEMHLYRCVMKCPEGHPMILLNQFQKVDETKWPRICDEYWYPIRRWKVLEFLSDEMEVVEEIPIPEVSSLRGYNDYVEDTATALNLIRKSPEV